MNSSKTSRTVKATHLYHLEQRNSNLHLQHYKNPTHREPISSILKPFRLSPTKQSFPTSRQNIENTQNKLSVERKIQQLRKELLIAKNIQQKFQSNKLINKNNFSTLEKQIDKQPKLMKYFEKKSNSQIKLFAIPITVQERQIQQTTLSTQITKIPILKLQEKQTSILEDGINEDQVIQQYQSSIKLPSEPDSPQIIKKLQSNQFTQRSVSQGYIEKAKKLEWTPWPQNFEGWHASQADEVLLLQYQQFF